MKIAVVSLKGGVGKTFVAVNLSTYLYRYHQKKVLLIDLNGKVPNTILFAKAKPSYLGERLFQGITVTPFFHLKLADTIEDYYKKDLEILEKVYDFIIFDVPPNAAKIKKIEQFVDVILLVINPDFLSIYTNYKIYKILDPEKVKLIVNKYNKEIDLGIMSAIFGKPVGAVIPYSKDVIEAEKRLLPVVVYKENSKVTNAFDELCYLFTGKRIKKSVLEVLKSLFFV